MIQCFRYHLPFRRPFATAGGSLDAREGILFKLATGGITSWGEAAPLPGFSGETLDRVISQVRQHSEALHRLADKPDERQLASLLDETNLAPSLEFALETLLHGYEAARNNRPLRHHLFENPADSVPLNATLPITDVSTSVDLARTYWNRGYRTFKIKLDRSPESGFALMEKLRSLFPKARLRADANQSWQPDAAKHYLARLARLGTEYCEEPIHVTDPEELRQLRAGTSVPIALDETLCRTPTPHSWIRPGVADVVIVKPMVFGRLKKIYETIRVADTHEYTSIFTTSLESGIGRLMTATLASGLGSRQHAHGLATGSLFKIDLYDDRAYINNGNFNLPDGPGMGKEYQPEPEKLALDTIDF